SDVSARELVAFGPSESQPAGNALSVEDALAVALARASAAQEWAVVAQLAREHEARRLSAAGAAISGSAPGRGRERSRSSPLRQLIHSPPERDETIGVVGNEGGVLVA